MKRLLVFCAFFPLGCLAQKRDTILKYFDNALNLTTAKQAAYVGAAVRQPEGWFLFALYPDTSYVFKGYYKDKRFTVKEGPYELYYPKNKPAVTGFYHNNSMVGLWRTWYPNGQLKDSGMLYYNRRMGLWKSWYENGRLHDESSFTSDTAQQELELQQALAKIQSQTWGIKDGAYRSWYLNGNLEAEGTYTNDSLNGLWRWYHQNGKPSTVEVYKADVLTSLNCYDTLGTDQGTMCSISRPALLRQFGDYHQYLQQNLVWPEEALNAGIEGEVNVTFRITRFGHLEQLHVESSSPMLKKAVEQFFNTMTDWLPAVSHNRLVDSEEAITVPFYKD